MDHFANSIARGKDEVIDRLAIIAREKLKNDPEVLELEKEWRKLEHSWCRPGLCIKDEENCPYGEEE